MARLDVQPDSQIWDYINQKIESKFPSQGSDEHPWTTMGKFVTNMLQDDTGVSFANPMATPVAIIKGGKILPTVLQSQADLFGDPSRGFGNPVRFSKEAMKHYPIKNESPLGRLFNKLQFTEPEVLAQDALWEKPLQSFMPQEYAQPIRVYHARGGGSPSGSHFGGYGHARKVPYANVDLWEEIQSDAEKLISAAQNEDLLKIMIRDVSERTPPDRIFAMPDIAGSLMRKGGKVESIYQNIPKQMGMVQDTLRVGVPHPDYFTWDMHSWDPSELKKYLERVTDPTNISGAANYYDPKKPLKNEQIVSAGGEIRESSWPIDWEMDLPIWTRPKDVELARELNLWEAPARKPDIIGEMQRYKEYLDKSEPMHASSVLDALARNPDNLKPVVSPTTVDRFGTSTLRYPWYDRDAHDLLFDLLIPNKRRQTVRPIAEPDPELFKAVVEDTKASIEPKYLFGNSVEDYVQRMWKRDPLSFYYFGLRRK